VGALAGLPAEMERGSFYFTQGDTWSGCLLIDVNASTTVQYKYIIADWRYPSAANAEWEIGAYNRRLDLGKPKSTIICGTSPLIQMTGGIWIRLRSIYLSPMVKIAQVLIITLWAI
jgi:hypothetical protein